MATKGDRSTHALALSACAIGWICRHGRKLSKHNGETAKTGEITSSHSSMAKKSGQTCVRCHISSLIDQISRLVSRSSRETRGCGGKTWTMFSCGFPPVFYSVITSHVECSRHRR
ncbi:hypothetical protein JOB18_026735 [Solea senegalensis]|uniref:Secreted protein n=1 Tax=Solea senegalensis TaxID=28829 RepID=A0AAV6RDK0_SOLSE|nr:hypothetical protein JOB18_026735 [Solea senegalensis]